jgi:tRNA pseudouridine55 synthase
MSELSGFLPLDKPANWTSAEIAREVARLAACRCGHLGTLDPMATGLLVLCLGDALKLVPYVQKGRKRYMARVTFGIATDTFDIEGEVVKSKALPANLFARLPRVLQRFAGEIDQVPPPYSAIKQDGERLFRKARRGEEVLPEPRKVTLYRLSVVSKQADSVVLDVTCSAGTYVRSLANDLGVALSCPATLSSLRRLESEPFTLEGAVDFESLRSGKSDVAQCLRPVESALPALPQVVVGEKQERQILHGAPLRLDGAPAEGLFLAMSEAGKLLAIMEKSPASELVRVKRVIAARPPTQGSYSCSP